MRKPDFFLAGAPKCGTRSMYEYLKPHPEIYLSPRKEPRYFASDLDTGTAGDELFFVRELDEYLGLFQGATDQKRVGEASVQYLYSRVAAENIRVFNPDSRFLVMLRNPVEAVHSMHAQRLAGGAEDIADFEAALDAEDDRRDGRRIPPGSFHVKGLIYRDVARFGEQVERWLGVFPRERFHFVIFDDLRDDAPGVYRRVLEFLEVEPAFRPPTFDVMNQSKRVRSGALRRVLRSPTGHRIAERVVPEWVIGAVRPLLQPLYRANTKVEKRAPMRPETRARLEEVFAPDVALLSELLERDLSRIWFGADARGRDAVRMGVEPTG